jgi:hypothetical protein
MTQPSDTRRFLRDLGLLLGIPLILVVAALIHWRPWELLPWTTHPVSEPIFEARRALEARARRDSIRSIEWHGFTVHAPPAYVLTASEPTLELLELAPGPSDANYWPAQMAFLDLDSLALARFRESAENCSLAQDRCWTETASGHTLDCQRSSGVPDPAVPWTPHLECQIEPLGLRVLVNAPVPATNQLLGILKQALASP